MAEPRTFKLELKDRGGALLDKECRVTVGLEGLTLAGGAASEALGKLGWNTLLRVRRRAWRRAARARRPRRTPQPRAAMPRRTPQR